MSWRCLGNLSQPRDLDTRQLLSDDISYSPSSSPFRPRKKTTMGLKTFALVSLATLGTAASLPGQKPLSDEPETNRPINVARKPLVTSEELQATIHSKNLLARAEQLYEIAKSSQNEWNHPTRVIGSKGHLRTLKYIHGALHALGDYYTLSKQPFPAVNGYVFEDQLLLDHDIAYSAAAMSLTPPTKNKQPVDGELVLVQSVGCRPDDFPDNVAGNIVLIRRGECAFGDKSRLAGEAGAVAAIIYNNMWGPLTGTLGAPSPDHVATFGISLEEAEPYITKLNKGEKVKATAYIDAIVETIFTSNIIAQTTKGDPNNCVMLGAHSDSVFEGPGINDDGSGSLALLEIATQLTNFSVNNCVRFAWWSAEEEGLLGSDFYVQELSPEENKKIRLFMDYDMLASPNYAYQIYDAQDGVHPAGSKELRDLYVDWYVKNGLNFTFIEFDGRSDYDAFIRDGIPAGGIATGAEGIKTQEEAEEFGGEGGVPYDKCYHMLCDDVSNLDLPAWEVNTKVSTQDVYPVAVLCNDADKRSWSRTRSQLTPIRLKGFLKELRCPSRRPLIGKKHTKARSSTTVPRCSFRCTVVGCMAMRSRGWKPWTGR